MPSVAEAVAALDKNPEAFMDSLDIYVNHEKRVVTYKWLSRELGVSVNVAKQMLYTFSSKCAENGSKVHATFALGGWLTTGKDASEKSHCVVVVDQEGLEAAKSKFNPLSFIHVYSVEPGQVEDISSALYNADFGIDTVLLCQSKAKFDAIVCNEVELKKPQQRVTPQPTAPGKPSVAKATTSLPSKPSTPPPKPAPLAKPTKQISSFFEKSSKAAASNASTSGANSSKGKTTQGALHFKKQFPSTSAATKKPAPAKPAAETLQQSKAPEKPVASNKRRQILSDDEDEGDAPKAPVKSRRIIDDDAEDDEDDVEVVEERSIELKKVESNDEPSEKKVEEEELKQPIQHDMEEASPIQEEHEEEMEGGDANESTPTEEKQADGSHEEHVTMDEDIMIEDDLAAMEAMDWDDDDISELNGPNKKAAAKKAPPKKKAEPKHVVHETVPPPKPMHVPAGKKEVTRTFMDGKYLRTVVDTVDDPDYVPPPPKPAAPAKKHVSPPKKGGDKGKSDGKGKQRSIMSFFVRK